MKKPSLSPIEQRLIKDAHELPTCPEALRRNVLSTIASDEFDDIEVAWEEPTQPSTGPVVSMWVGIAAALVLSFSAYHALHKPSATVPTEKVAVSLTLPDADTQGAVNRMSGTIKDVFENPYQEEIQHLGQDVEAATRFLMAQWGASKQPVDAPTKPQG